MNKFFPFLRSLESYTRAKFRLDLSAGLVVGVMLIPQGMAYAMIAGLPPVYGLYTAILPSVIYTFLGTSRHVSVGPVAMDSLILLAGVSAIAVVGTDEYLTLVITISLIVGLLQLTFGLLRLGFIANFLSKPVILGFTFAAAVLISIKQLKYLLQINPEEGSNLFAEFKFYFLNISDTHLPTLILSVIALIILIIGKKVRPKFPASLLLVVFSVLISYYLDFKMMGIDLVGVMPGGLPTFSIPNWEGLPWRQVIPVAVTLALMGFVEIYSIGQTLQDKHKDEYEIEPNRELIGIGLGNILGSFFRSFPATAGFSRSAVNESAGAQTGIAALISVSVVVLTLVFLMPVFQFLPNAILEDYHLLFYCLILFAFTTIMAYFYYCDRAVLYFGGGKKMLLINKVFFMITLVIGATTQPTIIWQVTNIAYSMMAIPNLISLWFVKDKIKNIFRSVN